ncbi:MAG: hypothetical protein HC779_04415 [Phyllobacteriaceae bacterium]|nr:hypothetical protein [Phyllobacteriaceae bacterium]
MFIVLKSSFQRALLASAAAMVLASCASHAPRLSGTTSFVLTDVSVQADGRELALANALEVEALPPLNGARPATADITIDLVRYDSLVIGLFYGGPDHASASVILRDADGAALERFTVHVAANGEGEAANAALSARIVSIIGARAANAWPVMKSVPKAAAIAAPAPLPAPPPMPAAPVPAAVPAVPDDVPLVMAPEVDVSQIGAPCVIGADGRCIPL